ncbi:MAG: PAS domain-containing protein, partial [Burkholderiales bacterium]
MTTGPSRVKRLALALGLMTVGAAVLGLFRRRLSRETQSATVAMLDALPNPVYFKSADGRYMGVNSAWEAFLGIPRDAVIGKTAQELQPRERTVMERLEGSVATVRPSPGFHVYEDVIALPDGARHDAIVCKATCMRTDGRIAGLVGTIIDVTDRKRAERRMAMEHAVTRVLAEAESLDGVVTTIIETICKTLGWHCGALYTYQAEEAVLRCEEMWGVDKPNIREFMAAVRRRIVKVDDPGKGLIRRALGLGKPVWISDIAADETFQRRPLVVRA